MISNRPHIFSWSVPNKYYVTLYSYRCETDETWTHVYDEPLVSQLLNERTGILRVYMSGRHCCNYRGQPKIRGPGWLSVFMNRSITRVYFHVIRLIRSLLTIGQALYTTSPCIHYRASANESTLDWSHSASI